MFGNRRGKSMLVARSPRSSTMRRRARNGWVATSVAAVVVALMHSASAPSAGSQLQPAGGQAGAGQAAAGQPAGQQGRGGGRGAQPRVRKALLAWADTRNGQAQHAFTSHALAIVERLGYESGLWDTFIRTDSHIIFNQAQKTDGTPASGGPSLSNVDGIFFLGHRDVPITDQQKAELLAFVRGGKGFVAAHTGLTAFESWPEFAEMLGAAYGGHLYTGPGRMISEQPAHPIVKHWGTTRRLQRRVLPRERAVSGQGRRAASVRSGERTGVGPSGRW